MKAALLVRPSLGRGDRVSVLEEGIREWHGRVLAVKFSARSGYWVEIHRDDGGTYSMPAANVRLAAVQP